MTEKPKQRSLRPVDAATMVLWRKRRGGTIEVLMGRRHRNHVFMPHAYVFPGGRVDAIDAKLNPPSPLPADVQARLERAANPTRARAIAAGAVAGITALDISCAKGLASEGQLVTEWDYSDRSGFPQGADAMRGRVEAEFAAGRAEPNGYPVSTLLH